MAAHAKTDGAQGDATPAEGKAPLTVRLVGGLIAWLTATKFRLGGAFTGLIVALSLTWYLANRQPPPTHAELLIQALDLLDDRGSRLSREQARKIARQLEAVKERDPDFPGGVEFILGMAMFRDAEEAGEATREARHLAAIKLLRDAENRGLADEREPEWLYALGTSLHRVGSVSAARPLLERAVAVCDEGRDEVMSLLVDTYLDLKTPRELERALTISQELTTLPLNPEKRDRALMQQAQVLMALGRKTEGEAALRQVSEASWNLGTRVFNAQTLMARQEYREAMKDLERVASDGGLDRTFPRQASYLMGICAEKQGDIDTAVAQFERTATRFERTHEALAARLRAADLLRKMGRDEEALAGYRAACRTVRNPDDFRNRWITLAEFRRSILDAWTGWVSEKDFAWAIELTRFMRPLMPAREAKELEARAQHAWAETLEREFVAARWAEQQSLRGPLAERWRKSADAYAALADLQRTLPVYPDTLWISAEHYARGRDYERAIEQIDAFIETQPKRFLPLALVRRGQALKDLDRPDEALALFRAVIREHPTDPAVFEARYLVGVCELERGAIAEAELAWRGILASSDLTPDALQWRQSLFELGRLLYHEACRKAGKARVGADVDVLSDLGRVVPAEAYRGWDEAAQKFDEFVRRYPNDPNLAEARYLLARSLQCGAGQHREKLRTAETENSRTELRRTLDAQLEAALSELQTLRARLLEQSEATGLDPIRRKMLRNTYFEIAGVWYALEQYDKAVIAYSGAANRYPQDPHVLLAYLQMAQCYERLGKDVEARSMLQQARVIFAGMQDGTFASRNTSLSRDEWGQWLTWASRLRDPAAARTTSTP